MRYPRLRYVHTFEDRHGKVRSYFRRPGFPRLALPGLPGTTEFMDAYQAALRGDRLPIGKDRVKAGSLDALAVAWYASTGFKELGAITRATYRNIVEKLRARPLKPGSAIKLGELPVKQLDAQAVGKLIAGKAETPAAANRLLSILRLLMRFAVAERLRADDPTRDVRRVRHRTEGFHTWTEEEIAAYEARWPVGTRERLALALLLYTGQRRADVVRMGVQHVRQGAIDVVQGKTGARLSIPIHPALRAALDACPSGHLTFLVTDEGKRSKPFTAAGFSQWFTERARDAGLPKGCSPHGLRKAAARRLAEAGCTPHQIAAVTGHVTLKEVERYTKAADQGRLAEAAIARIGTREPTGA